MAVMEFSKKVENYNEDLNNYVAERELTVTITLAEYRDLVAFKAKHEPTQRALITEKYNLENELKQLKGKVAGLLLKYSQEESEDDLK